MIVVIKRKTKTHFHNTTIIEAMKVEYHQSIDNETFITIFPKCGRNLTYKYSVDKNHNQEHQHVFSNSITIYVD